MPSGAQDAKHSVVGLTMDYLRSRNNCSRSVRNGTPWLMKVITRPLDNALVIQFHNVQQNLCSPAVRASVIWSWGREFKLIVTSPHFAVKGA
jgi:hypothetical protein